MLDSEIQDRSRFDFVELFAGVGGFRLGLEMLLSDSKSKLGTNLVATIERFECVQFP